MQHHHTAFKADSFASGFILLLTLLLSGCSSGGGSDTADFGNSLPPASGPGDVENFFPTTIGSSWNYFATVTNPLDGAPAYFMDDVTVTGTSPVNGQIASVFEESNPSGSAVAISAYFLKNSGGLAYLGSSDPADTMTAAIVPYILATFPVTPGIVANFHKTGLDFGVDLDGDGINESANVSVTNRIDGFEPLEMGIGTFARTLKSNEAISGTVILSVSKASVLFSGSTTRWLAPGIGVLKNNQVITAGESTSAVTTVTDMEARGYVVSDGTNSVAHGLGLPFQLASGLGSGDSSLQSPGAPAVASDGSHFLVVSAKSDASAMQGKLMDSQGALTSTIALAPGTAPVAAFDGTNYWVVYSASSTSAAGCYAQRVTPTGAVLDATPVVLSASAYCVSPQRVAFGNSNGLIVYSRFNLITGHHDLYGVLVNLDGTVPGSEFPIVADGNDHLSPVVAFDGTNYMVAWEEQRPTALPPPSYTSYIYATPVKPDGGVLYTGGFPISTNATGQYSPSIAFDGSNYLIAWLDLRAQTGVVPPLHPDIYAARVSPAGLLLDGFLPTSSGFLISNGAALQLSSPYVSYTGSEYLVAWGSLDYGYAGGVQAARVSTDGTLPAGANKHIAVSGPPPSATTSRYVYPAIGAGSSAALMVWLDNAEMSGTQKGVLGVSVAPF